MSERLGQFVTFNGLNPLARMIALQTHNVSGVIRMDTIRKLAHEAEMTYLLPEALQQLRDLKVGQECPGCEALVTGNNGHAQGCAKKTVASSQPSVVSGKRRRA